MYKELEQRVECVADMRMRQLEKDITAIQEKSKGILEGKQMVLNVARQMETNEANKSCPCCRGEEAIAETDDASMFAYESGDFTVYEDGDTLGKQVLIGRFVYCPICGRKLGSE